MKLFSFVKGIFGRSASAPVAVEAVAEDVISHDVESAIATGTDPGQVEEIPTGIPVAQAPEMIGEVDVNNSEVLLPLATIIPAMPADLQQRVLKHRVADTSIALSMAKILTQLAQGSVRVTFGEIRQSEPSAFSGGIDRDHVMVVLPLGELVNRLGPILSSLRSSRSKVEVPDEIVSPFASRGEGLAIGKPPAKSPGTSFTARPRGAQSTASVPPADLPPRGNLNSLSAPPAQPVTPGTAFVIKKSQPASPARPANTPAPSTSSSLPPARGAAPKAPIGAMPLGGFARPTETPVVPANGANGSNGITQQPSAPISMLAVGASAATPPSPVSQLIVSFSEVESTLPDSVRLEAAQLNLAEAKLALSNDLVAEGLKRGKVEFTWKQLRSAIVPSVAPGVSAHDGLVVALPLSVIAPLFLLNAKQRGVGQKRVVVDEKIPNLFFGFPQSENSAVVAAPVAPVAPVVAAPAVPELSAPREIPVVSAPKPAETNYFVFDDVSDTSLMINPDSRPGAQAAASAPGTNFTRRKATPNEVVTKASLLEGVYGALVALPDGLPVAAKLDPSQNGEAIAALIPQMYSKLSGCTKELRMGELNNLNFTVGNVPWKIFRVNGIFFAAFGTAGEPLPTAHLTELARELDYKKAQ